jgi:hypothetical protein
MAKMTKFLIVLVSFLLIPFVSMAWLYPEHRDITLVALGKLNPGQRARMDALWAKARVGWENRLTVSIADPHQNTKPAQLDFAAWPAIAGDHSCSPADLLETVLKSDWILKVADIAARLKNGLAKSKFNSDRDNHTRDADIRFVRVDPEYVSRAGGNNVHFLLALEKIDQTAENYFDSCCRAGSPLNALGVYIWFHSRALSKAKLLSSTSGLTSGEQSQAALAILADEAFALHFLEDAFASGHVAGTWGNAAQRKGTHDYYDAEGLSVTTWAGRRLTIMGDSYMKEGDAEIAAVTIRQSLEQLASLLDNGQGSGVITENRDFLQPDTFSTCDLMVMPALTANPDMQRQCYSVLMTTPYPGLGKGKGTLPRFSAELGPFFGFSSALSGSSMMNGFGNTQNSFGFIPGMEVAFRVGIGLDGVLNSSSDGLVFLQAGYRLDGSSTMKFADFPALENYGGYTAAVPSRDALSFRIRLPFYLIPCDLILLVPVLAVISPKAMNKAIVKAGNGGLIPWQAAITTPVGRLQFILGREMGVSFYGSKSNTDTYLLPTGNANGQVLFNMNTTQLNFPVLEYRFMRKYGASQTADMSMQIEGGMDIPGKKSVIFPAGSSIPAMQNIYFIKLRFMFDYRHYVSSSANKRN